MRLRYTDLSGAHHDVSATITTNDSLSSYGQPVVRLANGETIDGLSWVLMGYRILSIEPGEKELMQRWLATVNFLVSR